MCNGKCRCGGNHEKELRECFKDTWLESAGIEEEIYVSVGQYAMNCGHDKVKELENVILAGEEPTGEELNSVLHDIQAFTETNYSTYDAFKKGVVVGSFTSSVVGSIKDAVLRMQMDSKLERIKNLLGRLD